MTASTSPSAVRWERPYGFFLLPTFHPEEIDVVHDDTQLDPRGAVNVLRMEPTPDGLTWLRIEYPELHAAVGERVMVEAIRQGFEAAGYVVQHGLARVGLGGEGTDSRARLLRIVADVEQAAYFERERLLAAT